MIQQARKDAVLDVVDRINLALTVADDTAAALASHTNMIAGAVLATDISINPDAPGDASFSAEVTLDGSPMTITLVKAGN